jgi:hypothetical protein
MTTADIDTTTPDLSRVDADPRKFALTDWIAGAARVTRSVEVCGRPDLMGVVEELKAELERPAGAATAGDERPHAPRTANADDAHREDIARRLEAAREEMLESIVVWKFGSPSIRQDGRTVTGDDAVKAIQDIVGKDNIPTDGSISEFDYRIWAAQVISVAGTKVTVEWDQLAELHAKLGPYFVQTIGRTANAAIRAEGVDVPFSLRSSAIIAKSSPR